MKKLLLFSCLMGVYITQQAQVIFSVEAPAAIAGTMAFTDNGATGDWGLPDLLDPADAVLDTLILGEDGTPGINPQGIDSTYECCSAITNNVAGKIVMIYRNTCSFGTKALNAQNAGAVAVVIVNREPGLVNMLGGTEGLSVTIPVTFISAADGAILRASLDASEDVVLFIGNKTGFYNDDIGLRHSDVTMSEMTANPQLLSQSATEFNVYPEAWVQNYGINPQSAVTLTCDIEYGGANIYSQTSAPVSIASGDSSYITLPLFTQSSYGTGYYKMTYTVSDAGITDQFQSDNTLELGFMITDKLFSYAPMDSLTGMPIVSATFQPAGATSGYTTCIHFQDPNASRMGIEGMWTAASGGLGDSLVGELVEVYVYEWNDSFTGISDAGINVSMINQLEFGDYTYTADLQAENVYIPLNNQVALVDDQRYLFCQTVYSADLYLGYNQNIDYDENVNSVYDQPITVVNDPGTSAWYVLGFGTDAVSTITADLFDITIGINEEASKVNVNAYPNPTRDYLRVDFGEHTGHIMFEVMDVTGRIVIAEDFVLSGSVIMIDASDLTDGNYTCRTTFADGSNTTFNIVISK